MGKVKITPHIKPPAAVLLYFSKMGKVGGKTKGAAKVRGDSEYYRALQARRGWRNYE